MAVRQTIQNDFSGGELSPRMLGRPDLEVFKRSLLTMQNFIPTLQGSAVSAPGSRFIKEALDPRVGRIFPYLTLANERSLAEMTPLKMNVTRGIAERVSGDSAIGSSALPAFQKQIVRDSGLAQHGGNWELDPEEYVGGNGDLLGMTWEEAFIVGTSRVFKYTNVEKDFCRITTTAEVDVATDRITLEFDLWYLSNFFFKGAYDCTVKIGSSVGNDDVFSFVFEGDPGFRVTPTAQRDLPTLGFTGTLYIDIRWVAKTSTEEKYSQPRFALIFFRIWAAADPPPDDVELVTPYTAEDLPDVHYVASPYDDKPLVFVHPNHPPQEFLFDTTFGSYQFRAITFLNQPDAWTVGNYPSTVTAVQGRCVFAGIPNATETVWATEVGDWRKFSVETGVNPDDSLEFTTIYRSPIQWMSGHKNLLVGALEMEYLASAEGIFQPADLGVSVQSTHGGIHVQPVGFGPSVLFAAEGGTHVRSASFSGEENGWVAPDLTLWTPDLFSSGIVRMVRMRNPHQMMVAVMGNGQLAILHQDNYAGIMGWSRIVLNAKVIDACVIADENGIDILFILIRRTIDGVEKLFIEAFSEWTDSIAQNYMASFLSLIVEDTNVILGLEHLEGVVVQVVSGGDYLGVFTVSGGQITLVNEIGQPINVISVTVGRAMSRILRTLPADAGAPDSKKRYTDVSIRTIASTRPIINGQRPADREPLRPMDHSQSLDLVKDLSVSNLGWDDVQIITIEETLPLRTEILGIFGKLTSNKP